ncbi:hypothetical protein H8356DRAFT_1415768 [Neocallimastix lanati (nom. inval.)]|nr:hypothetical protein H8356DRAFT_1415768 [Neocallimastix sp. JGI-2020a]
MDQNNSIKEEKNDNYKLGITIMNLLPLRSMLDFLACFREQYCVTGVLGASENIKLSTHSFEHIFVIKTCMFILIIEAYIKFSVNKTLTFSKNPMEIELNANQPQVISSYKFNRINIKIDNKPYKNITENECKSMDIKYKISQILCRFHQAVVENANRRGILNIVIIIIHCKVKMLPIMIDFRINDYKQHVNEHILK